MRRGREIEDRSQRLYFRSIRFLAVCGAIMALLGLASGDWGGALILVGATVLFWELSRLTYDLSQSERFGRQALEYLLLAKTIIGLKDKQIEALKGGRGQ